MPGKVKVRILAARGLPVMDKSNDTTDAFVELKLGQTVYKTEVFRKSLNPTFNSEWFRFEMDDLELQDEPLQIRLMDYDIYSANDAIGKVYIDLNPLLISPSKTKDNWGRTISGWIPVYDTMHGARGELNLIVKVELFSDLNKYRQSSCGIRFFFSPQIPDGYAAQSILGFVEELVVEDDPEYLWIDKIRTPRASNEARQTLFQKLSGEVQRRVGLKALELGANTVVGYKQSLDLEGETGIVVRGIGTAMYLTKVYENQLSPMPLPTADPAPNAKESCFSLLHQHSLPRQRKPKIESPLRQRSFRHLNPLPSMPLPVTATDSKEVDPPVDNLSRKAKQFSLRQQYSGSGRGNSGLSSSFSNLLVRKSSKSPSPTALALQSPKTCRRYEAPNEEIETGLPSTSAVDQSTLLNKVPQNTRTTDTRTSADDPEKRFSVRDSSTINTAREERVSESFLLCELQPAALKMAKNNAGNNDPSAPPTTDLPTDKIRADLDDSKRFQSSTATANKSFTSDRFFEDTRLSEIREEKQKEPSSLSEKESDCSIYEDSPPTSPSSSSKNFAILGNLKRKRWTSKRDRLSTNCLVKRASSASASSTASSVNFKEELGRLFKRISFAGDGDEERDKSQQKKVTLKTPYRQPRKLFFRKRRRSRTLRSHESQVVRSKSEHETGAIIMQTSSESLNSGCSEPAVFSQHDDEDFSQENASSLIEIPTYIQRFGGCEIRKNEKDATKTDGDEGESIPVDHPKLKELINDLGYDVGKPLSLYISSMNALLLYDPASGTVNSSCVCLNVESSVGAGSSCPFKSVSHPPPEQLHGRLDIDIVEKMEGLLNARFGTNISRTNSNSQRPCRNYPLALTECPSSTSSNTSVSSSSASVSTSATSSSCKGLMSLTLNRQLKMRRTDDDEVDELDLEGSSKIVEKVLTSEDDAVKFNTPGSLMPITGCCRSPIPEELTELTGLPSKSQCSPATHATFPDRSTSTSESAPEHGTLGVKKEEEMKDSAVTNPIDNTSNRFNHGPLTQRRSSESDLSTTPKGPGGGFVRHQPRINMGALYTREFPFITLSKFPQGFIKRLGGTVMARSVKLLTAVSGDDCDTETRDSWWNELRVELRSHCRAYGCSAILAYEEQTTICEDLCILSATGTAVVTETGTDGTEGHGSSPQFARGRHESEEPDFSCSMLHFSRGKTSTISVTGSRTRCQVCMKAKVPDIIFSTIDLPTELKVTGEPCLIQVQVFRSKKESKGDAGAKEMSDSVPFLEYELYRRLINKLKIKGMNALFGFKPQIIIGEKLVIGVATATAVFLTALPPPSLPTVSAGNPSANSQKIVQFQKVIQETNDRNREKFGINNIVPPAQSIAYIGSSASDGDSDLEDEMEDTKQTFLLEVDDAEDIDIIAMLIDPTTLEGCNMTNLEVGNTPGVQITSQQMINQLWRCKIHSLSQRQLTNYFDRLLGCISFKLRRMQPCLLSKLVFHIECPEPDEMQLCIIGMALGLEKKSVSSQSNSGTSKSAGLKVEEDADIMFPFEEDKLKQTNGSVSTDASNSAQDLKISAPSSATSREPVVKSGTTGKTGSLHSPVAGAVAVNLGQGNSWIPVGMANVSSSEQNTTACYTSLASSQFKCESEPLTHTKLRTESTSSSTSTSNSRNDDQELNSGVRHVLSQSLAQALGRHNVCSVRHPNSNSRSSKLMTLSKPMPSPVSKMKNWVEITPLSIIPGTKVERYLGNLNFYFIRETSGLRESGGLSTFMHAFFTEILAVVRAHVSALGGNALLSYFMTRCAILHNPHKNQGQCVLNVGGDAAYVVYPIVEE